MQRTWTPRIRPERLICTARVLLAVFSLLAVWLDPTEPANFAPLAYALMVGYVIYAWVVALIIWRSQGLGRSWPMAMHAIDLVFFSAFIFFTSGPGSPFIVYFVFALVCATIRWQLVGTLWTAALSLAVFIAFGIYFGVFDGTPDFQARAFVIRGVYLFILSGLLSYLGMHEQHLVRDLWLLSSWPHAADTQLEPLVRPLMAHAATLLEAPASALVWQGPGDGPLAHVAVVRGGDWTYTREPVPPRTVHPDLWDRSFLWRNTRTPDVLVQDAARPWSLHPWSGRALAPGWLERLDAACMLAVSVNGEMVNGRYFVLNKAEMSSDDALVADVVAGVLAARLDAYYLDRQLQAGAASDERVKLARDLHDGVLQSFTGIGLRLAAIRGHLSQAAPVVDTLIDAEIDQLQHIITAEHKELRFLIQDLKPSLEGASLSLDRRLAELVTRVEREWDLEVQLTVDVPPDLPRRFCQDLYHIVREGLTNAARHGLASTATVAVIAESGDCIRVCLADDGRGFTFTGTYTGEELASMGAGPKTLRERVQALNGSFMVESSATGAAVHIVLPAVA